jgi:hypothetical protein
MIVFNGQALVLFILGLVPGGITWLISKYLVHATERSIDTWSICALAAGMALFDLAMRVPDPKKEQGAFNFLRPSGGGHVCFVPVWIIGIAAFVLRVT